MPYVQNLALGLIGDRAMYEDDGGYEGPAGRLVGKTLPGDWLVKERLDRSDGATGGLYSIGYVVESPGGTTAYMKAHDYAHAINQNIADFSRVLADMLSAHNFERDLNEHCLQSQMSRVVRVLDAGAIAVEGSELPVNYLIFELANGDVRNRLADFAGGDLSWKLRTVHQVATGLAQLHRAGVIHQDMKPSNIMDFGDDGSKIGDLGNAWHSGRTSPMISSDFAGDPAYAPPECLFDFELPDVTARLKARDLYMFGSLILFLFGGVDATSALLTKLPIKHHPGATSADFEQTLTYLIEASDQVVDEFEADLGTGPLRGVADRYRELCDPDPRYRGHPKSQARYSDPYALDRYISFFDHLAGLAEGGDSLQ